MTLHSNILQRERDLLGRTYENNDLWVHEVMIVYEKNFIVPSKCLQY